MSEQEGGGASPEDFNPERESKEQEEAEKFDDEGKLTLAEASQVEKDKTPDQSPERESKEEVEVSDIRIEKRNNNEDVILDGGDDLTNAELGVDVCEALQPGCCTHGGEIGRERFRDNLLDNKEIRPLGTFSVALFSTRFKGEKEWPRYRRVLISNVNSRGVQEMTIIMNQAVEEVLTERGGGKKRNDTKRSKRKIK